jgi:hypothetical protein
LDRQGDFGPGTASRELIIWLYFAAFIAGVLIFGFYVAVPVMLVAFLHFETRFSLPRALLAGVGATAILYAAFGTVLQIRLHHGFVMHLLGA